jgi:peptidoglycan L-alanyl-D-glutamate endopeptidase CwlK
MFALAEAEGISLLITHTHRSFEEQDALYAKGRTEPGDKVTDAKGGETPHNYRLAFDAVPLKEDGSPWWDAPPPIWQKLYRIAERVGLDALGDKWGEFLSWDKGHFHEPGWRVVRHVVFV